MINECYFCGNQLKQSADKNYYICKCGYSFCIENNVLNLIYLKINNNSYFTSLVYYKDGEHDIVYEPGDSDIFFNFMENNRMLLTPYYLCKFSQKEILEKEKVLKIFK